MALSQQIPVYPIDRVIPFWAAKRVIYSDAYWVPRSEWKITVAGRSPRSTMVIMREDWPVTPHGFTKQSTCGKRPHLFSMRIVAGSLTQPILRV